MNKTETFTMPEYLEILRTTSIASIYILFAEVIVLLLIKGKIKDRSLQVFAYVWVPLAALTQFFMTYFRLNLHKSNLPLMNFYLIFEMTVLIYVLLRIRKKYRKKEINALIWISVVLVGIVLHFSDALDSLHSAAILYTAIVYFNLTISFVDLEKANKIYRDPYALINLGVFVKAVGYSYLTIYNIDYKFPLSIYSSMNLLVQMIFFMAIIYYYKHEVADISGRET